MRGLLGRVKDTRIHGPWEVTAAPSVVLYCGGAVCRGDGLGGCDGDNGDMISMLPRLCSGQLFLFTVVLNLDGVGACDPE